MFNIIGSRSAKGASDQQRKVFEVMILQTLTQRCNKIPGFVVTDVQVFALNFLSIKWL